MAGRYGDTYNLGFSESDDDTQSLLNDMTPNYDSIGRFNSLMPNLQSNQKPYSYSMGSELGTDDLIAANVDINVPKTCVGSACKQIQKGLKKMAKKLSRKAKKGGRRKRRRTRKGGKKRKRKKRTRRRKRKRRRKKAGTLNKRTKRKLDAWGIDVNAKGDLTKLEKKSLSRRL